MFHRDKSLASELSLRVKEPAPGAAVHTDMFSTFTSGNLWIIAESCWGFERREDVKARPSTLCST